MRKKTPNQLIIEFTHDVLRFKEHHQLRLPPDHVAEPILSEVHLSELAKTYETRGFLHGSKSCPLYTSDAADEADRDVRDPCSLTSTTSLSSYHKQL